MNGYLLRKRNVMIPEILIDMREFDSVIAIMRLVVFFIYTSNSKYDTKKDKNFSNAKFVSFLFQGSYLDEKRPGCFKLFNVGTSHFYEPQSCALA